MKRLMTGDEAVARGAWEAGVRYASAYPGTPSTEILENLTTYEEIQAEWAPNEKTAMESAIGASIAGVRSMVSMKHVGMNVAADPMFTWAYMGVNGGNVIVTADVGKRQHFESIAQNAADFFELVAIVRCENYFHLLILLLSFHLYFYLSYFLNNIPQS